MTDMNDPTSPRMDNGPADTEIWMPSPDEAAAAASRGVRRALAIHKALGVPTAIWRDGRVVIVPAEELPALPADVPPAATR